jgi:pyruvate dehydrogenase E2 component (dihydrolipoamide acetyltransferase)
MGRRRRGGSLLSIKGETRIVEPTPEERSVARRAAEARATVPHLEVSLASPGEVSSSRLVRACALALVEYPRANAAYRDGRFELYSRINVGLVVAATDTYVIPTIFDAERKTAPELEREVAELTTAATDGVLTSPALSGATFTVWNAGEHGLADASIPPVPPQAAALAAGTSALTLACDHRILYGASAAAFLKAVADHLDRHGA